MSRTTIKYHLTVGLSLLLTLTGCLKGEMDEYDTWRDLNDAYVKSIDLSEYEKVAPSWAPLNPVYMKWHNDRALTASNLVPMSTSTVEMKYELEDINGKKIENSYSRKDSVYTSRPQQNIIGMEIALTTMHVGDSVTVIIPYASGYGNEIKTNMLPYTNLIYHLKLKSIKAYEKPAS